MDTLPIEVDWRDATAEEIKTLLHVADSLPLIVFGSFGYWRSRTIYLLRILSSLA